MILFYLSAVQAENHRKDTNLMLYLILLNQVASGAYDSLFIALNVQSVWVFKLKARQCIPYI